MFLFYRRVVCGLGCQITHHLHTHRKEGCDVRIKFMLLTSQDTLGGEFNNTQCTGKYNETNRVVTFQNEETIKEAKICQLFNNSKLNKYWEMTAFNSKLKTRRELSIRPPAVYSKSKLAQRAQSSVPKY